MNLKLLLAHALFRIFRAMEALVGPTLLYRALLPFATLLALSERYLPGLGLEDGPRLGSALRTTAATTTWRQRRRIHLNRVIEFFPDRLRLPGWSRRCAFHGFDQVVAAREAGKPVVLAFCHFGAFTMMGRWLRARGVPATTLVAGNPTSEPPAVALKRQVQLCPQSPNIVYTSDLRSAVDLLSKGTVLLIALDYPSGKLIDVPLADDPQSATWRLATGAIRLARRTGAELIPCAIIDHGGWRFTARFGQMVPGKVLHGSPDSVLRAALHLVRELAPTLDRYPEQWGQELLDAMQPEQPPENDSPATSEGRGIVK